MDKKIETLNSKIDIEYQKSMDLIEKFKSKMAQDLKNLLDNMSQEEFDKTWNEVTNHNIDGIRFEDVGDFIEYQKQVSFDLGISDDINRIDKSINNFFNSNCGMPKIE